MTEVTAESLSTSWHTYPSIYALGHKCLVDLLADPVLVEEKVDGSQFSFGRFNGELRARSKGKELVLDAPEKMFQKAVDVIEGLDLHDGWTYRAEYLQKPKHNVLAYDRIPSGHLVIFDINTGHEEYMTWEDKADEAARLELDIVPKLFEGVIEGADQFRALLDTVSCLGGQKIEGVVVKNYRRFGPDKKVLMGKFVSEAFKEVSSHEWKKANPAGSDVIQLLIMDYKTPARWQKAIQHLTEAGALEGSPRDIGKLMKETGMDVRTECTDEIKQKLYDWAWPKIQRGITSGLPEWYKEQLLKQQFEKEDVA